MQQQACGTSRIVGCRFSLYPMSDRFVELILSALEETDRSKVWVRTDDVSTCIRGREAHVFDVVKSVFVHAAKSGVHVVFNGTFSIGCPGDSEGDVYMIMDDLRMNEPGTEPHRFEAACQFALYPMGIPNYMDVIYDQVKRVDERGTFTGGVHYASRLDGDVHAVFASLEEAFKHAQSSASHVVMTAAVSANSPSKKQN